MLRVDGTNGKAYFYKGKIHKKEGKLNDAVLYFEQVIKHEEDG